MNYWLMKSEPDTFSIDDLIKRPKQVEPWEGVRNFQARNFIKSMKKHDKAFFYHSSCEIPGIVGIMEIITDPYPDPSAFMKPSSSAIMEAEKGGPKSYYDPKSTLENPRWYCVDVHFLEKFQNIIPLKILKEEKLLQRLPLVQQGNRLSVMPVNMNEWKTILSLNS